MKPNLCTEHAPAPKMPQKQGRNSFWGILRVGEEIRIFGQNIDPCNVVKSMGKVNGKYVQYGIHVWVTPDARNLANFLDNPIAPRKALAAPTMKLFHRVPLLV